MYTEVPVDMDASEYVLIEPFELVVELSSTGAGLTRGIEMETVLKQVSRVCSLLALGTVSNTF